MFDFSLGKLLIVALIALLVLGPDKLPGAARTAGALIRRLRSGWDSVRAEVERELEVEEIRRAARQAAADAESVQAQASTTLQHLNEELEKVRDIRHQLDGRPMDAVAEVPAVAAIAAPQSQRATQDAPQAITTAQADGQPEAR